MYGRETIVRETIQRYVERPDRRGMATQVAWGGNDVDGFCTSHMTHGMGGPTESSMPVQIELAALQASRHAIASVLKHSGRFTRRPECSFERQPLSSGQRTSPWWGKIERGMRTWTPWVPSTTCVTPKSEATLISE
jgi:hypothetical protein